MNRKNSKKVAFVLAVALVLTVICANGIAVTTASAEETVEITVQDHVEGDKIPLAYTDGVFNMAEGVDGYDAEVMSGTRIP